MWTGEPVDRDARRQTFALAERLDDILGNPDPGRRVEPDACVLARKSYLG
jgi:hypothetical protein